MRLTVMVMGVLMLFSCNTVKDGYETRISDVVIALDENSVELTSTLIPGMNFRGTLEGNTIYITQVRVFSNWQNGWTEGFYQASGKYLIVEDGKDYLLEEVDPIEIWDIESGEIRYRGKYYRKDDGLQKVRNRVQRIEEYARIIKEYGGPNYIGGVKKVTTASKFTIHGHLYPKLFPEVLGFEKLEDSRELHSRYYKSDFEIEKIEGSNIFWRTDYTKALFPEHLWELRNSGTIFRDFEEAPYLVMSYYNLEGFINKKLYNCRFIKIED